MTPTPRLTEQQAVVDAIRAVLGLEPLYAKGPRGLDVERHSGAVHAWPSRGVTGTGMTKRLHSDRAR